jgi:hypothetical protein
MRKRKWRKSARLKTRLGLPDLEQAKSAVLVSLRSSESQRSYQHSINEFVLWYCSEPRLSFNKTVVTRKTAERTGARSSDTINWLIGPVDLYGQVTRFGEFAQRSKFGTLMAT